MKKIARVFIISFLAAIFMADMVSLSFAQQPLPIKPNIPVGPEVVIPDDPQIREFSVNPTSVMQGEQVTFRWRVEPGPGGSQVNSIRLTIGAREVVRSSDLSGEYRYTLPEDMRPGRAEFILHATNQIGRTEMRSVNVNVTIARGSSGSYRVSFMDSTLTMSPERVQSGQSVTFNFSVRNDGDRLTNIRIRVVQPADNLGRGVILRDLERQVINPGVNNYAVTGTFRSTTNDKRGVSIVLIDTTSGATIARSRYRELVFVPSFRHYYLDRYH